MWHYGLDTFASKSLGLGMWMLVLLSYTLLVSLCKQIYIVFGIISNCKLFRTFYI